MRTTLYAVALAIFVSLASGEGEAAEIALPPGPDRDLVYGHCRTCHDLQFVTESRGISRDQWASVLDTMHQLGMPQMSAGERAKLLDYLGTYLGPNPPPEDKGPHAPGAGVTTARGEDIFRQQCSACHQPGGRGVPGVFPPLAGNSDLFLSRDYPALVVLHGLSGKVTVAGRTYNGAMPPFAHLSDAQIAAVIRYVRSAWGNDKLRPPGMAEIDAGVVKALRAKSMSASAVHGYRRGLAPGR